MKIAIVNPPLLGHIGRGVGNYTLHLFQELNKRKNEVSVKMISISDKKDDFDLIHYPYFDPFFLTLPIFQNKPTIVSVHDLIPLRYPDKFPPGLKGKLRWNIQKLALQNSKFVITDSYASQNDIITYTGIQKHKMRVVYLASGKEFKRINDSKAMSETIKNLHLPNKYILYVGDVNYNKNISGLLRAFYQVFQQDNHCHLVLVGVGFVNQSKELDEIQRLIKQLQIGKNIHILGKVTEKQLVHLYNLAQIYIQPSFAEGFGLPILEAMASGCPVITSRNTSLSEIAGSAAVYIDPMSDSQMSTALIDLIDNENKKEKLIQLGFKQANRFSWEKTAEEMIRIYAQLYEKKHE